MRKAYWKNKAIFLETQLEKARCELEQANRGFEELESVYKGIIGAMVFTYAPDGSIELPKTSIDDFIQSDKVVTVKRDNDNYTLTCK